MKGTIGIILLLAAFVIFGFRIAKKIEFKQNVSGYLKRAADANTIPLAEEELSRALQYLEEQQLTNGNTGVFIQTPDRDITFWYKNLKASQQELQNLNSTSALEKTNVLIKLRETLVDTGESTKVTVPPGIDVYPNNKLWALLIFFALAGGFTGFIMLMVLLDQKSKEMMKEKEAKAGTG
jgi:hypothetical protein